MVLPSHLTDGTSCCSPFAISTQRATQLLSLCQPTTRHGTGSVMQGRRRSDAIRGVISKPRDNKKARRPADRHAIVHLPRHQRWPPGIARIRMRRSLTTEKCPSHSTCDARLSATNCGTVCFDMLASRNRTMPCDTGIRARKAKSPKSLSKVTRRRDSSEARRSMSVSAVPDPPSDTHATSCPALRRIATAEPGTFSSASILMSPGGYAAPIGNTFSERSTSPAYRRHALMSSVLRRG